MSSLFHGGHLLSILIFFPGVGALALLGRMFERT